MNSRTLTVQLVTPAFLGGANQSSEWRVPPIKALLRQWWRVAYGPKVNYDESKLREAEGALWGHAGLRHPPNDSRGKAWAYRSRVSLVVRLLHSMFAWAGTENSINTGKEVVHPEVEAKRGMKPGPGGKGAYIGSLLYLGYGPLGTRGQKHPPALAASSCTPNRPVNGQLATLTLSWSDRSAVDSEALDLTLKLVHLFGCIGGRSRNGFGSLELLDSNSAPIASLEELGSLLPSVQADLERCLELDWPHAIGTTAGKPLIWKARNSHKSWEDAMAELAEVKIAYLTRMGYSPIARNGLAPRHLANYPVTNHSMRAWDTHRPSFRLANQLRFKVHRVKQASGEERFLPIVFHLPHRLPQPLRRVLAEPEKSWLVEKEQNKDHYNEIEVWTEVHKVLAQKLQPAG